MFKKSFIIVTVAAFLAVLALSACDSTQKDANDPKQRLNEYISKSFGAKSLEDKTELMTYLTGEAKARLSAWSEDQFRQAFIDSKRQFLKLAFKEAKKVSPDEMDITYEISYLDNARGTNVRVTNKKMGTLVQENGKWMIKDVHNIKELIEYQNEMSLP
jgi:hypothetical protein